MRLCDSFIVRRLDHQRQTLERDRLVAPVELESFPGSKAHGNECLGRNPRLFVAPRLHEPVHTVVRTVIAAAA
jgi:hypothetical protein